LEEMFDITKTACDLVHLLFTGGHKS
jgi:hypothetical protein